jgi:hypothetical protein
MHTFSEDGSTVVFVDAFGLTRLSLPKKLKTDRKHAGHWLSGGGGGDVLAVGPDGVPTAFELPDFKKAGKKKYDFKNPMYAFDAMTMDGRGISCGRTRIGVIGKYGIGATFEFRTDSDRVLELGIEERPERRVARAFDPKCFAAEESVWCGAGGSYAALCNGMLHAGAFGPAEHAEIASIKVGFRVGLKRAWPSPEGVCLVVFEPRSGKSHCAWITQDAVLLAIIEGNAPATWDGSRLLVEVDEGIARRSFESDAVEILPFDDAVRPGTTMAHGDTVLWLSGDGERIVDVSSNTAINRNLPAAEKAQRRSMLNIHGRYGALLRAANIELCMSEFKAGPPTSAQFRWSDGDDSLVAGIVIGNLVREDCGTSASAFRILNKPSLEDLSATVAEVQTAGLDFLGGLCFLGDTLSDMDLDDDVLDSLLALSVAAAAGSPISTTPGDNGAPTVDAVLALGPESFEALDLPNGRGCAAQIALGHLLVRSFAEKSIPVFLDWLILRPTEFLKSRPDALCGQFTGRPAPLTALIGTAAEGKPAREQFVGALRKAALTGPEASERVERLLACI